MTTILECTKCNQQFEVTARVLHFPFVCEGCSVVDSNESEENSEGGDIMSETQEYVTEGFTESPYLDHADATVENTNALFDQLEEQLAQANADKEGLITDIKSLSQQLEQAATVNRFIAKGAILLAAELQESLAWEDLSHAALAKALEKISDLDLTLFARDAQIGNNAVYIQSLKAEVARLTSQRDWARQERGWKQTQIDNLNKALDWEYRPLWKKVLHFFQFKTYSKFVGDPQPAINSTLSIGE